MENEKRSKIKRLKWIYSLLISAFLLFVNMFSLLTPLGFAGGIGISVFLLPFLDSKIPESTIEKYILFFKRGDFFWYGISVSIVVNSIILAFFDDYFILNSTYINPKTDSMVYRLLILPNSFIFNFVFYVFLKQKIVEKLLNDLRNLAINYNNKHTAKFHYYSFFLYIQKYFQIIGLSRFPDESIEQLLNRYLESNPVYYQD